MTKIRDKHFEKLTFWEGKLLDALSEEVLLINGEPILFPSHQLPFYPSFYERSLGGDFLLQVFF